MTSIWYEVFPVTLFENNVALVRTSGDVDVAPWLLAHQPHLHPNKLVLTLLNKMLGELPCLDKTIVHSTSWRYDTPTDRMLLTYLAILPQNCWPQQGQTLERSLVGNILASLGDNLSPALNIEYQHVLAHALDHLASLNSYDPTIQAALEDEWQDILLSRQPKPAGGLQRLPVGFSAETC